MKKKLAIAGAVLALTALTLVTRGTTGQNVQRRTNSCQSLCKQKDPTCLLVNYRGADVDGAMGLFREEFLQDLPLAIEPSRVAQIFSMEEKIQTMETRSNIDVDLKGWFANSGVERTVTLARAGSEVVSVHFPGSLKGRLWRSGDDIEFVFDDREQALSLSFGSETVSARFGGTIEKIYATDENSIFEMPSGCVQIPFTDSLLADEVLRTANSALLLVGDAASDLLAPLTRDYGSDEYCNPPGPNCIDILD